MGGSVESASASCSSRPELVIALAFDGSGNLYAAAMGTGRILKLTGKY
jgi:hypothetical protein